MNKRYFYTCPIKALYMMKEFMVKYEGDDLVFTDFDKERKIYVAKESEHIFEPKLGDMDEIGRFFIKEETPTEFFFYKRKPFCNL